MDILSFESHILELALSLVWLIMGITLVIVCLRIRHVTKIMGGESKIYRPLTFSSFAGLAAGSAFLLEWIFQQTGYLCWHAPVTGVVAYGISTGIVIGIVASVMRYYRLVQIIGINQ